MSEASEKKLHGIFYYINIILMLILVYFFIIISAKYYLMTGHSGISEKMFRYTGIKKGYFLSLIDNGKFEKARNLAKTPEFEGLYAWSQNDFSKAAEKFLQSGDRTYLFYSYFKDGKIKEAGELAGENKDPSLNAHLMLLTNRYEEAVPLFLKKRNYGGLFKMFIQMNNFPTAIYYLLKNGGIYAPVIADLMCRRDVTPLSEAYIAENRHKDFMNWIFMLKSDYNSLNKSVKSSDADMNALVSVINGSFDVFFTSMNKRIEPFLYSLAPLHTDTDNSQLEDKLIKQNEDLRVYSIVPEENITGEYNRSFLIFFAAVLGVLGIMFPVALFYLYKKYQSYKSVQRQKDLEKMDALSIAKIQSLEAKKKRDKTELNVSSFVTLNIQMEVLDLAFSKLGLRVNPNKLTEELEKSKIPNISYKIYTISNSYGLSVKMLSVEFNDLPKQLQSGVVVIILKGDLIALLKNADAQNAYLQFSQKDSRKVPLNALKLSWEGNIILLNRI